MHTELLKHLHDRLRHLAHQIGPLRLYEGEIVERLPQLPSRGAGIGEIVRQPAVLPAEFGHQGSLARNRVGSLPQQVRLHRRDSRIRSRSAAACAASSVKTTDSELWREVGMAGLSPAAEVA